MQPSLRIGADELHRFATQAHRLSFQCVNSRRRTVWSLNSRYQRSRVQVVNALNILTLNLQVHPAGDCLIWLWRLNAGGYGTASFPDQERLAHRQAFTQSRRCPTDLNVLHLCHRPFCVQPSHLYDGSAKENSQDRQVRTSQEFHMNSSLRNQGPSKQWPNTVGLRLRELLKGPCLSRQRNMIASSSCPQWTASFARLAVATTCLAMQTATWPVRLSPTVTTRTLPAYQSVHVLSGTSPKASSSKPASPRIIQFP